MNDLQVADIFIKCISDRFRYNDDSANGIDRFHRLQKYDIYNHLSQDQFKRVILFIQKNVHSNEEIQLINYYLEKKMKKRAKIELAKTKEEKFLKIREANSKRRKF